MRRIKARTITENVAKLCIDANYYLSGDIKKQINESIKTETSAMGRDVLEKLLQNADIAENEQMAICQDTGMAVVFIKIGQDVMVEGSIEEAVNQGVRQGYQKGFLRKSIVSDPLRRVNTGDNTPAVIHYEINEGDTIEITVAPKGFGSENMSAVKMLKPSDGEKGVIDFVIETVKRQAQTHVRPWS